MMDFMNAVIDDYVEADGAVPEKKSKKDKKAKKADEAAAKEAEDYSERDDYTEIKKTDER